MTLLTADEIVGRYTGANPGALIPAMRRTSKQAFETVIEAHLLANAYGSIAGDGFDRERAIFPETVLSFIRETQPME